MDVRRHEEAALTNAARKRWVVSAGWDGTLDIRADSDANIDKPLLANELRHIADQLSPRTDVADEPIAWDALPASVREMRNNYLRAHAQALFAVEGIPTDGATLEHLVRALRADRDRQRAVAESATQEALTEARVADEGNALVRDLIDDRDRLRTAVAAYQRAYHALDHAVGDVGPQYRDWKAAQAVLLELSTADPQEATDG